MALRRSHASPGGHWSWPVHVTHRHGVRCGEMIFVGGQLDLDPHGTVRHPGDLRAQTRSVVANLGAVLAEFGAGLDDVVKLAVYYVSEGRTDEHGMLADVGAAFGGAPGPAVTAVPLPRLAYPGLAVEIEAIAMRAANGARLVRDGRTLDGHWPLAAPFCHGVRCGELIYASAEAAHDHTGAPFHPGDAVQQSHVVMANLDRTLHHFGATLEDAVKLNTYYVGQGRRTDWEPTARACARHFIEPGPVVTTVPVPELHPSGTMVKADAIAMLGTDLRRKPRSHVWPDGHWDWPVAMPYRHGLRCGDLVFVGGQAALDPRGEVVAAGDMVAQTRAAMDNLRDVLAGFGAGVDDVIKVNAFYVGGRSPDEFHTNLRIRSGFFAEPGPASTGIPLPSLAHDGLTVEVEAIAMTEARTA